MITDHTDEGLGEKITRRKLLQGTGSGLFALSAGGLIAACGSSKSGSQSGSAAAAGTPKRGGEFQLGASGGGTTDTLDAQLLETNADYARGFALYEGCTTTDPHGRTVNLLAESIESNPKATEWTIRIRPGVLAHNGKPFGAKDVLFSFRRLIDKKLPGAAALGPIDLAAAKVMDARTLRVPFSSAYAILPEQLAFNGTFLVPVGFDPHHNPIGTGPFKYKSFTPGTTSTFVRWDQYWDHPRPYLDTLIINNIADETAQVNALQSGQVQAIDYLSASSVAAVKAAGGRTIVSKTGAWGPFTMRVDRPPFNDVRVRLALKLAVDRPQMIQQVFGGYGTVGNDVWGIFDPDFYHGLPQRHQDIEQAKSLLKAAGQPNPRAVLVTTTSSPGEVQAAQVLATQAAAAGFQIKLDQQEPTAYFNSSYGKVDFSQDFFPYQPYLVDAGYATVTHAAYNNTHFSDPSYDKLYKHAIQTLDNGSRKQAIRQMLEIDYKQGGNLIPYYFPVIDGVTSQVQGIVPSVTGVALGNFNWKEIWLKGS